MKQTPNIFEMTKQERKKYLLKVHRKAANEGKGLDKPRHQVIKGLGENIREKRKSRNMTAQALHEVCKIPKAQIINIENGKQNPTVETLIKIAEALGCRLEINLVRLKSPNSEGQKDVADLQDGLDLSC